MRLRIRLLHIVLFSVWIVAGCGSVDEGDNASETIAVSSPKSDYTENAKYWADSLLKSMTLEERVGQLFMPSSYAVADQPTLRKLKEYVADCHVGGIVFLKGDMRSQAVLSDSLQALSTTPLFIALDAEWGLNMRYAEAPRYPVNSRLARASDQIMYEYGFEVARQARRLGINMLLGPVLDVLGRDGGVIGYRSFGKDAKIVSALGIAYSRGVEDGSVITVSKHFPGHGSAKEDSHNYLPIVYSDSALLDSVDLLPFREYINAGLSGIMVGHIAMPAIDDELQSAVLSPKIMKSLLREKMDFAGLILTDAMNMRGAGENIDGGASVEVLRSGADIVISPFDTKKEIAAVINAVNKGDLTIEEINEKVRRILFFKYKAGLYDIARISSGGVADDVCNEAAYRLSELLDSIAMLRF